MTTLLSTAQAWSRLSTHIEWADRFWVLFVFTDDPRVSDTLCQRTHDQLAGEGIGFRVLSPEKPEGVDDVITELLAGPSTAITWVDLVDHDDPTGKPVWGQAWARVMLRLNERREALRRRSPQGGIVFATTLGRLGQTPALAPDLWTIRALLLRVATEPGPLPSTYAMDFEVRSPGPRRVPTRDRGLARQAVERAPGRDLKRLAAVVALVEAETGDATLEPAHEVDALVVELREQLAPQQQGPLVNVLRRVGDVLVAENHDAEAVSFYRRAVERGEQVHGTRVHPEVAAALGGLGRALAQMAEYSHDRCALLRQEALEVTRESVEAWRELARERPQPHQRALAEALDSLVLRLKESGYVKEELVVSKEVVEHWQTLADQQPDQAVAKLAIALRTLGDCHAALGQREEALALIQRAVALHRELVGRHPERFSGELAKSLSSLGVRLNQLGRLQEGLDAQNEAHALIHDAAEREPRVLTQELAFITARLGAALRDLGQRRAGLEASQEAVEILRELERQQPGVSTSTLARALSGLSASLLQVGRREEALEASRESLSLWRTVIRRDPEVNRASFAATLSSHSEILRQLDRNQDALEAAREAVDMYRDLAQENPEAVEKNYAASLLNLGILLHHVHQLEDSARALSESVEILRARSARYPEAIAGFFINSLRNFANILIELKRYDQALKITKEGIDLFHTHAERRGQVDRPILAALIFTQGKILTSMGEHALASDKVAYALRTILTDFIELPAAHGHHTVIIARYLQWLHDKHGLSIPPHLAPAVDALLDLDHHDPAEWTVADFEPPQALVLAANLQKANDGDPE